mmetsp:Transcript_90220/g.280883  ORF Transcript_90220/g.280883 Transcript_90220/m.280883 type:complete len:331 (+) Transcript_90220:1514-2506(+)
MVFTAFSAESEAKCTAVRASCIMACSFLSPSAVNLSRASLATLSAPFAFLDSIMASQRVKDTTASARLPFSSFCTRASACSASGTAFLALSSSIRQMAMLWRAPASRAFLPSSSKDFCASEAFCTAVSQLLDLALARPTMYWAMALPMVSLISSEMASASSASESILSASFVEKCASADSRRHLAVSFLSPTSLARVTASVAGSSASRRLLRRGLSLPISAMASCMTAWPRLSPASLNFASSSCASFRPSSGSLYVMYASRRCAPTMRCRVSTAPSLPVSPSALNLPRASSATLRHSFVSAASSSPSAAEKSMEASRLGPDAAESSAMQV